MAAIRDNLLVVRLTPRERAVIDTLAKFEKLPVSTLARRMLLTQAEARGIVMLPDHSNGAATALEKRSGAVGNHPALSEDKAEGYPNATPS